VVEGRDQVTKARQAGRSSDRFPRAQADQHHRPGADVQQLPVHLRC